MRQGSVFTPVCHSVHGGVSAPVHAGIHPLGRHPPAQCMLGYTPPAQCILEYTPRPVHAGIHMATAADGTHPTGMHSCYIKCDWLDNEFGVQVPLPITVQPLLCRLCQADLIKLLPGFL